MEFKNRGAVLGSSYFIGGVITLAAGLSPSAAADDGALRGSAVIDEVVVTAALLNELDGSVSGNARVLLGSEVANAATEGLGGVLDDLLGVSVTDFGGAVSRPTIRGLSGDRVKVLNNTVSTRDVSGLGADHSMDVDLFNIEQIEVVKGPASLLFTNGALGGIVNVVDNAIAKKELVESETSLGYETQSVNDGDVRFIYHRSNVGGINLSASFKDSEFENYEVPTGAILESDGDHHDDEVESNELANSDNSKENFRIGLSKVADWGFVGVSYASNDGLYGVPFHMEEIHAEKKKDNDHDDHDDHGDGHEAHDGERIFAATDSQIISLEGAFNVQMGWVNSVNYHFRDTDYELIEAHAEEADARAAHAGHAHGGPTVFLNDAQEFGAVFDLSSDVLIQKLSISIVSEDQSIGGAEKFMNPVASDELTLGYFLSRALGDYVVDLGVRNDWVERSGSVTESHDEDDGDHDEEVEYFKTDESITSFGLQIGRRFTDQVTTTLNLSSVEKAPAAVELFMNGAHLATGRNEVGDPNLRTERAKNVEFTMDYDSDALFASLAVYENQIDNYIYLQDTAATEDGLIVATYQQQDAEFRGYELEFGGNIALKGGVLTLSYGLDNVSAEFSDNSNVPRINPSRSIYSASYAKDLWDLSLVFKDVDSQKDTAMFEDATDSYSMLDFRVSNRFQLSSDLALNVSVFGSNLLDEAARNHSSFVKNQVPLPGRSYGVKVYATF